MELIDTHCHLNLPEFDADRKEAVQRAREAGVTHMVVVGIDPASSIEALEMAGQHEFISATVGHHPHDAAFLAADGLDRLRELAGRPGVVGFGEIGLDFFRDLSPRDVQRRLFADLIRVGLEARLPLVIHDRDAHEEIYGMLKDAGGGRNGGVIHCFSGDYDLARRFVDLGFHISIPGMVTFPKAADVREVARRMPLDTLLVETDAPYLAPVPKRGRRNEPAYVRYTAAAVAELRGVPLEDLARATTENARALFRLPDGRRS